MKIKIHKEGKTLVQYSLALGIVILYFTVKKIFNGQWLYLFPAMLTFALCGLIIHFFRNPSITLNKIYGTVISPANGTVIDISKVYENEYFKDERIKISIFMSPLDVHINRNPISGIVKYFKHHHGNYLIASHPKASEKNERTTIVIIDDKNREVLFRQIAGYVARRIRYYDSVGKEVEQSNECGFIKFGSRADVFLPLDTKIRVKLKDKTIAGVTVIAEL